MKRKSFLVFMLSLGLLGCSGSDDRSIPLDGGWGDDIYSNSLAIMSYNICHCSPYVGSGIDTPAEINNVAKVLGSKQVDVVLLQEVDSCTTRSLLKDQAKELAQLAGFKYYHFFKQKDYQGGGYGVAILSKYELKEIINHQLPTVIDGQEIKGNNILGTAKITVLDEDIYIATTHLSVTESEQAKQFPKILEELNKYAGHPIVLGGDFNSKPSDSIITNWMEAGFKRTNNDPNNFTIPSDKPNRELDYIGFKPADTFHVVSHTVLTGINASDHLPIIAILQLK